MSKMNESNSMKAIDKIILSEQRKFRLSEIIEIENYFYQEINQRKSRSKKLNKYVTVFDYIDSFNCFKCNKQWSINYFIYKYYWSTSWNSKCKPYFIFSLTTGIVKKLLNITRNKKKKHDKIFMLA